MNEVMLTVVGNVVSEPELTVTSEGAALTTFRIASTTRRLDQASGQMKARDTLYLRVRCWRGLAHSVAGSLTAGSPVIVQGRLRMRSVPVDGPEGPSRRTFTDIDAFAVGLDLARAEFTAAAAA